MNMYAAVPCTGRQQAKYRDTDTSVHTNTHRGKTQTHPPAHKIHAGDSLAQEVVNMYRNRADNTAEDVPYPRLQATDTKASVDMLSVPLTGMEKRHGEQKGIRWGHLFTQLPTLIPRSRGQRDRFPHNDSNSSDHLDCK